MFTCLLWCPVGFDLAPALFLILLFILLVKSSLYAGDILPNFVFP
jgi:hypothetical protein